MRIGNLQVRYFPLKDATTRLLTFHQYRDRVQLTVDSCVHVDETENETPSKIFCGAIPPIVGVLGKSGKSDYLESVDSDLPIPNGSSERIVRCTGKNG